MSIPILVTADADPAEEIVRQFSKNMMSMRVSVFVARTFSK
jgi:hypothetical protein